MINGSVPSLTLLIVINVKSINIAIILVEINRIRSLNDSPWARVVVTLGVGGCLNAALVASGR
jgi:hypothetical protein